MASIINYALSAKDSFAERPLCRVDSLCFSWLAYLRFPDELGVSSIEGVRIADLNDASLRSKLVASLHSLQNSSMLVQAMALSPRFRDVRVCLYEAESSEAEGKQFAATSFVLPDGVGAYVAFRGTDDTVLGWKENFRLIGVTPVPAQEHALRYLEQVTTIMPGPLWVGGHSKGGNLAEYACHHASDVVRQRVVMCFTHDGPGFRPELRAKGTWYDDVPVEKTVPRESLVGMLFERSQQGLIVVRSSETGVMQHAPFSWEVRGNDFACEQGMDYDAWRLSQRLNDWLADMDSGACAAFANLLAWLVDATGETSFSALLQRWSSNERVMRAALDAAPAEDRELFERAMDDLVTTLLLGSKQEHGIDQDESPRGTADAASRKIEDLTARANDHFAKLDRLTGK